MYIYIYIYICERGKAPYVYAHTISCNPMQPHQQQSELYRSHLFLPFSRTPHRRAQGRPRVRAERGQRVQHDVSLRDNPSYV